MLAVALFAAPLALAAQQTADWTRPFPPFRIIGNIYWVGSYDLSTYLITTPAGNILVNSGVEPSAGQIEASVEQLGFKMSDTKILTATHDHYDHVAGMAALKRMTGARLVIAQEDKDLLETGGKTYRVIIANMGSINPGVHVSGMATYAGITADYEATFRAQKAMKIDVWLASHASQFHLHDKYKPGDAYDPEHFVDPAGFLASVQELEKTFHDQLAKERAGR